MAHQAKLFALSNLANQIESERIKLQGNPPKPGTHEHDMLLAKAADWERIIANIRRDLKSQSHFNHMVYQQNRFGDGSYAAGQRLKSQDRNVAELSGALADVAKRLAKFVQTLWDGPNAATRALDGLDHALSNWLDAMKQSEQDVLGPVPQDLQASVRQLEAQLPQDNVITPPGLIDIFTVLLSLVVLIKSQRKGD